MIPNRRQRGGQLSTMNSSIDLPQNKHYDICSKCKVPIILDNEVRDIHGESIPLNLTQEKRHYCSGPELILHEQKVVKEIQNELDKANKYQFSSFQLRLVFDDIEDYKSSSKSDQAELSRDVIIF
jgi:hypothetical protein